MFFLSEIKLGQKKKKMKTGTKSSKLFFSHKMIPYPCNFNFLQIG